MSASTRVTLLGLSPADHARLWALTDLVSRLPEVAERPVEMIERFDDLIRSGGGLKFECRSTGRAGELRLTLQFSQGLRDLCAALGAGDLCCDLVGQPEYISSIGSLAPTDVARQDDPRPLGRPDVAFPRSAA